MPPSVLVTKRLPSAVMSRLAESCEVELHSGAEPLAQDELRQKVRGKAALICLLTDRIDRSAIDAGDHLEVIANVAVGYDNIDVSYARSKGIAVTNTPGVLTEAVAELTWALILGLARRIGEGERVIRSGRWKGWALDFLLGMELRGKQLGIIGMGAIGRAVAAKASAFGMRVAYAARSTVASQTPRHGQPTDAEAMPLDRLLVTSDVVSLHVPLTSETTHLIDQRALTRMKRTALLINTARGPVVDEAALVWALNERLIAGAALDVFEREPTIHPGLAELENVLLAPHIASATIETRTEMAALAVRNVLAVLAGQPALTPVG